MEHHGRALIFVLERIAIIIWGLSSCYIELWSLTVCLLVTFNIFHILRWFVGNSDDTMPVEQNANAAELDKAETDKENSLLEEESSEKLNYGNSEELVETILAAEFTENTRTENVEASDHDKDGAAQTKHKLESDQVSYKQETNESEDEVNESAEDDIPPLIDEEVKLQTGNLTPHQLMKICEPKARDIDSEANALTDTMWSSNKDSKTISKLEDEKKDLSAKLDAAIESLEHYRSKAVTDEQRRLEGKRDDFSAKLDLATESLVEHYRIKEMEFTDERCRLEEERNDLSAKLFETNNLYEHCFFAAEDLAAKYSANVEERNRLAAKIQAAYTMSEHYKSCNKDLEENCGVLRKENMNLCARISEECSSAQHFSDLFYEYEEKCRRLEEDKISLTAKLIAAKARAELYESFLHEVDR